MRKRCCHGIFLRLVLDGHLRLPLLRRVFQRRSGSMGNPDGQLHRAQPGTTPQHPLRCHRPLLPLGRQALQEMGREEIETMRFIKAQGKPTNGLPWAFFRRNLRARSERMRYSLELLRSNKQASRFSENEWLTDEKAICQSAAYSS